MFSARSELKAGAMLPHCWFATLVLFRDSSHMWHLVGKTVLYHCSLLCRLLPIYRFILDSRREEIQYSCRSFRLYGRILEMCVFLKPGVLQLLKRKRDSIARIFGTMQWLHILHSRSFQCKILAQFQLESITFWYIFRWVLLNITPAFAPGSRVLGNSTFHSSWAVAMSRSSTLFSSGEELIEKSVCKYNFNLHKRRIVVEKSNDGTIWWYRIIKIKASINFIKGNNRITCLRTLLWMNRK